MDDQAAGQIRLRFRSPLKSQGVSRAGGVEHADHVPGHPLHSTPAGTEDQHQWGAGRLEGVMEGAGQ
eukprot:11405809-Alexandrium_andersonii.AAC.1